MIGKNTFLLVALFVVVFTSAWLPGQVQRVGIKVEIPFDFIVSNTAMHAGEYEVRIFSDGPCAAGCTVIRVSGPNGSSALSFTQRQNGTNGAQDARLVFNKYGDERIFLSKLCLPGQPTQKLFMGSSERALAVTSWRVQKIALNLGPSNIAR